MKINRILNFKIKIAILLSILFCLHVAEYARANDLTHQWKSPAFSGSGYSSHVLTIENQEHSRKKAIREKREAAQRAHSCLLYCAHDPGWALSPVGHCSTSTALQELTF